MHCTQLSICLSVCHSLRALTQKTEVTESLNWVDRFPMLAFLNFITTFHSFRCYVLLS